MKIDWVMPKKSKLTHSLKQTDRQTDMCLYRAPMELKKVYSYHYCMESYRVKLPIRLQPDIVHFYHPPEINPYTHHQCIP